MNRAKMKQRWMAAFESKVLELNPKFTGKIDWNTAIFYWNNGRYASDAAVRYVENDHIHDKA